MTTKGRDESESVFITPVKFKPTDIYREEEVDPIHESPSDPEGLNDGECSQGSDPYPCYPGKYRSYSGHCNNVERGEWGSATMGFNRFLPPQYGDGVSSPRRSSSRGSDLPSPQEVSKSLHSGSEVEHPHVTTLTAFFAEFVLHDIAYTAKQSGYRISCCDFRSNEKITCKEFVQTCPTLKIGCKRGPREQINQVSSFIDGSTIYGSSEEEMKSLRSFYGGELKSQKVATMKKSRMRELLQPLNNIQDCRSADRRKCFKSGDIRVNENVGLTLMHTMWMREHNRIARKLSDLNPHWSDDTLFEEARRIVGGEIQHITFNELLPSILGEEVMDKYGLRLQISDHYRAYDTNVNPTMDNAAATSVYPFLYSMMPSRFERYSLQLKMLGTRKMGDTYFNASDLYDENMFDEYLMGLVSQNAHDSDLVVSNEMMTSSSSPFRSNNGQESVAPLDLVSRIIQQGRDHGISGYVEWRKMCKIQPDIKRFEDLETIIPASVVKKLSKLYK